MFLLTLLAALPVFEAGAHLESKVLGPGLSNLAPGVSIQATDSEALFGGLPTVESLLQTPAVPDSLAIRSASLDSAGKVGIEQGFGQLPMHFEPNVGQAADEVRFTARGAGYQLFLTETEAVLVLRKGRAAPNHPRRLMPRHFQVAVSTFRPSAPG